ncbi:rhodanese-like domain-containing protein [Flavobacterium ajazii]|uniref:rhodanese-like domain-containing protein n=1 Tax=Flavobacterium ajazii TaxID=2692318 RepID=UPI0013D14F08|nr:rhodanese-like domain-containing protein [Flavobacterium ajazii]
MKITALIILAGCCLITGIILSQASKKKMKEEKDHYPKALVDYDDFKNLVSELEKKRDERLVSLDVFLQMAKEKNTVILDSRSDFRFNRKHLKGAIHLDFTDFTQENLLELIPDPNTRILIYCNNNFNGDPIDFASKMAKPKSNPETQILSNRKPVILALNIPTHINLYGYGYKNIYELDELVNVNDPRIKFEGTEVK